MKRSIVPTGAALALLATSAMAGVIGPTRPSQLVVLRASGSGAVCLPKGGGIDLDLRVNADGTVSPYAPPPGYALVITGMDWNTDGGTPNEYTPVGIRVTGGPHPAQMVFVTGTQADAAGKSFGSAIVPNVAVAPGSSPCVGSSGGHFTQVVVHGFHTVNK